MSFRDLEAENFTTFNIAMCHLRAAMCTNSTEQIRLSTSSFVTLFSVRITTPSISPVVYNFFGNRRTMRILTDSLG